MVASASYEGTISRHRARIAELESDIERYSAQIRRLKSRGAAARAAAAAAAAAAAYVVPVPPPPAPRGAAEEDERAGKTRYWTEMEHNQFLYAGRLFGQKNYVAISQYVGTRTPKQVRTHAQKYQMKLEREARKRRAHAAAVAAGAPGAAAAAAAAAASFAAGPTDPALQAAVMAGFAAFPGGVPVAHPMHSPMPLAYYQPATSAPHTHAHGQPAVPPPAGLKNTPEDTSSSPATATSEELFSLDPSASMDASVSADADSGGVCGDEVQTPDHGLQYLRDSACSPVSNDSELVMVDEKGNAASCGGRGGNLADYDEFMRKVTRSSFEDADLDNMLTPDKAETFDDLLEEL